MTVAYALILLGHLRAAPSSARLVHFVDYPGNAWSDIGFLECQYDTFLALEGAFVGIVHVAIGPNRDIALFAGRFGSILLKNSRLRW